VIEGDCEKREFDEDGFFSLQKSLQFFSTMKATCNAKSFSNRNFEGISDS